MASLSVGAVDSASEKDRGPFGANGAETAAACRCGAGPHPEHANRCAAGHTVSGNDLALVTGAHSRRFWAGLHSEQQAVRRALLADQGHTEADAPEALIHAIDGAVQAVLLRDSAFVWIAESGGPTTLRGR